jgi:hypothetical protein
MSLSAARVIHGAVLDTFTADKTSGERAATWAALWQAGEVLIFVFRPAATALDDFTRRHLWGLMRTNGGPRRAWIA